MHELQRRFRRDRESAVAAVLELAGLAAQRSSLRPGRRRSDSAEVAAALVAELWIKGMRPVLAAPPDAPAEAWFTNAAEFIWRRRVRDAGPPDDHAGSGWRSSSGRDGGHLARASPARWTSHEPMDDASADARAADVAQLRRLGCSAMQITVFRLHVHEGLSLRAIARRLRRDYTSIRERRDRYLARLRSATLDVAAEPGAAPQEYAWD